MQTERQKIAQAVAKALAYRDAGSLVQAALWTSRLVQLLEQDHLLTEDAQIALHTAENPVVD